MIPILDTYQGGYTKALLDVKDMIQDRSDVIVWRKQMTKKSIKFVGQLIDAMVAGKDSVMKYGSAGVELIALTDGSLKIREPK